MEFVRNHILTITLFTPLAGAVVVMLLNKERIDAIRWVANIFAFAGFLVSLPLVFWFQSAQPGFQFTEEAAWIPSIGARYSLGIDGISLLLVMLTTVLGSISILSSWTAIQDRVKEYYVFFLVLQTGMLGVFMSLDFFLFYVFWEVMLVPMYFLIGIWGGPNKLYAAIKFFLFTLFGSVLMLLGILVLYFSYHTQFGAYTFDIRQLISLNLPLNTQIWVFLAFFVGFAIKVPMFPFHTWLPDAHTDAPTAASVILAGVLLKMGTYGFLRFNLPMFPEASQHFVPLVFVLSIIAIIYGAMVCMVQPDMKRLIAYSSVSHMGFVMLGMFAFNAQGVQGSLLQMINHGLSTGGLFLIVGLIYDRRHTRLISELGGLSRQMPIYATLFAIIMFASMGLPGLNGFIGEFLILIGVFQVRWWWGAFAVTGVILGAAYMLWLYQRTMFGEITKEENKTLPDLDAREMATLLPIIAFCFLIGLYPAPFLKAMEVSVANTIQAVEKGAAGKAIGPKQAAARQPGNLAIRQPGDSEPLIAQLPDRQVASVGGPEDAR